MRKRILIIEDEADLRLLVGTILGEAGYEVLHALDGATGLALAQAHRPDVILLDGSLPDMSGFEVLEKLRADDSSADRTVLILSADVRQGSRDRAVALGANGYITKPVLMADLLDEVRRAVE